MNARRLLVLGIMAMALAAVLSGCTVPVAEPRYPETEAGVAATITDFKAAVEAYNVSDEDGIATYFMNQSDVLTISEAGQSYSKSLDQLRSELLADADNQAYWRAAHGYSLELQLGPPAFSRMSDSGAMVVQSFTVWEEAENPVHQRRVTDHGTIAWTWVKSAGVWKISSMTITFETSVAYRTAAAGSEPVGLGFGTGYPGL
jgi:hypothetical protein